MKTIKIVKDNYPFMTRVQPVLIVLAPFFILGVLYSFEFQKFIHILTSIGIYSVLSFLVAELGRDAGLKKQAALWAAWGGPFTTQMLRPENPLLPRQTKLDYYAKLQRAYPVNGGFDPTADNDDTFAFWTGKLRDKTRDKKKYPLVYVENVSYGFRRNLWGMKPLGVSLAVLSSLALIVYYYCQLSTFNFFRYPMAFWINEILDGFLLLFWGLIVNGNWVKVPAMAYAERLLSNA